MEKADTKESLDRVRIITELKLRGASRSDIIEYCRKEWGIERAQVDCYIRKVNEGLVEEAKRDTEELFAEARAKNNIIYERAFKKNDFRTALAANKEQSELCGLKTIKIEQKLEVKEKELDISSLSEDELRQLKAIQEKIEKANNIINNDIDNARSE